MAICIGGPALEELKRFLDHVQSVTSAGPETNLCAGNLVPELERFGTGTTVDRNRWEVWSSLRTSVLCFSDSFKWTEEAVDFELKGCRPLACSWMAE